MPYTLGEAAKATGVSKPTLSKAVKSGRISATKSDNGSYSIDPAELHRVFPAVSDNRQGNGLALQNETPVNTSLQPRELLEKEQQERERERKQMQATIEDLRRRLDDEASDRRQSAEEIRRLTLLLTHQPEEKAKPLPAIRGKEREPMARERGSLPPWVWLFVGAGLVAAAGAAFVWAYPELFPWTLP